MLFLGAALGISLAVLLLESGNYLQMPHIKGPENSSLNAINPGNTIPQKQNYSLAFLLNPDNPYYQTNLHIFEENLKTGDFLLVYGTSAHVQDIVKRAKEIRDQGKDFKVYSVVAYRKIADMEASVPGLPKGIDFIMYDYEGGAGYSPEFTADEATSIASFARAKSLVDQYNNATGTTARLLVSPPYGQLAHSGWDWITASKNMDAVDVQLQAFLKDSRLGAYAKDLVGQVRKTPSDKLVFIQLSIVPSRGTVFDNVQAIHELEGIQGIDAFLIFYKNTQGKDLENLFSILHR